MIDPADMTVIKKTCDKLLTDYTIPLIVVTIESMNRYKPQPATSVPMDLYTTYTIPIEQFARTLYNQWKIGYPRKSGKIWNKGILLLVSRDDRKARIELGAGYGHMMDEECTTIMQKKIVNRFRTTMFSAGICSGVVALDIMAREAEGEESKAWFLNFWFLGAAVLIAGIIVWIVWKGKGGLGWLIRIAFYAGLGWLVYTQVGELGLGLVLLGGIFFEFMLILNVFGIFGISSGASSGGGSDMFTGGSFGGGFSGGGGATGSW
jgi:uncharacterized protein